MFFFVIGAIQIYYDDDNEQCCKETNNIIRIKENKLNNYW